MEAFLNWLFHSLFRPAFWFQPVFYSLHGWLATEMALWMLFHPYEAKYIPGTRIQLPFTPGIMPRGRENLSQGIADAVTRTLLTEADIHQQAEKLISEDSLVRCIEALLDSIEREMLNSEQIRRIYRYGEEVIPDMLSQLVSQGITSLDSAKSTKLKAIVSQLVEQALSKTGVGYQQAEFLTGLLFSTLLTPAYLRKLTIEGLTDGNILVIERNIADQVGGVKGLLVRFMGVDKTLTGLREFYKENPEDAEAQITSLLDQLAIRERLAEKISQFSFSELPTETREAVLHYATSLISESLVDNQAEISRLVGSWSGKGSRMIINYLLQFNLKELLNEKRPELKREIARFLDRYLHRELELMISRLLPVLDIGKMIIEKMNQFTNQQLEELIYGICRRELRWLAVLGAFLGFWLGLVSNLIHYFLQT